VSIAAGCARPPLATISFAPASTRDVLRPDRKTSAQLAKLEAQVTEAKAMLADAEVQVKLIESVADNRAVKKEDVLRRQQNYNAAKARLAQAEKNLALTKAGAWVPDLAIARTQVEQAAAVVARTKSTSNG